MSAWYLVQCKPQGAARAECNLHNQQFECFLPTHRVQRKRVGKLRWVNEPLFPHYLFIRLGDDSNWRSIRSTRGVARIVGFNGRPSPVPDELVSGLQKHCASRNLEAPPPPYHPGDTVVINDGCFKDLQAIVQATKGEERVVLLLNLLNRVHTIELPMVAISSAC
jgi:transcriptional antiterminator RfaH